MSLPLGFKSANLSCETSIAFLFPTLPSSPPPPLSPATVPVALALDIASYHSFQSDQLSPVDVWLVMVKSAMGDGFTLVASRAMGAIHLCVFVRHDIIDCVSNVSTTYVPCGIGNVMYNKGAVGVRMNFYDTSVAFICAHLAANKEKVQERCQDFHRIASVMIDNIGKNSTHAKMVKETDNVRESETIDLDFCDTRYQQRRSTIVEVKSNPLVELAQDEDIKIPEIRVRR
jgi:hypothetical protein